MAKLPHLESVTVMGVRSRPMQVLVNGVNIDFAFTKDQDMFVLILDQLSINMDSAFQINWI